MSASVGDNNTQQSSGYSGLAEQSGPLHAFFEYSTVLVFPFLFIVNLHWASTRLYEFELFWLIAIAIPLGVIGSDFITGLLHWVADTYGSEDTPVLGQSFVKPFRLHHLYPRDICTHKLVETAGNSCIVAVPVLAVCLYLLWLLPESPWLAFAVVWVTLMGAVTVATNHFHKWAHQESPSAFTRWLQRTHLILEPSHHEVHHTDPFNMHYCITNGWLNPVLNKLQFFRRLEATLRFFGIETARAKDDRVARMDGTD